MDPCRPELYLDPLLPLAVRRDPALMPRVAERIAARTLLVCTSGQCSLAARTDTMMLHGPGIIRTDAAEPGRLTRRDFHGWLLVLGGRLLDQLVVASFGEPGYSRFLEELDRSGRSPCGAIEPGLDEVLEALAAELDARNPAYRVRSRALLTDALLLLYRSSLVTAQMRNGDGRRLGAVLDHIELHYDEELSLADLATIMGSSPSYFSRLFRNEVGMPLFEYINRTRIQKACLLLRNPGLPITRIALDVGYNSVSFFNRYFRRVMNVSPREYRRFITS
jgi:AraC-like DNA-binding protein